MTAAHKGFIAALPLFILIVWANDAAFFGTLVGLSIFVTFWDQWT